MAVFAIANRTLKRIKGNILDEWKKLTTGKRPAWTDVFRAIIMKYWYKNKSIPLIALDFEVIETETEFQVKWTVLQLYIDKEKEEEIYDIKTRLIGKDEIESAPKPIYFSLYNDDGSRAVAPYILLEM